MGEREEDRRDLTQHESDVEQGEAGAADAPTAAEENEAHSTIISGDPLAGVQPDASEK